MKIKHLEAEKVDVETFYIYLAEEINVVVVINYN